MKKVSFLAKQTAAAKVLLLSNNNNLENHEEKNEFLRATERAAEYCKLPLKK